MNPLACEYVESGARNAPVPKIPVPRKRSVRRQRQTASKLPKINIPKIPLTHQAHTVTGNRGKVIPFARKSITVTARLTATRSEAAQNTATLEIQTVIAAAGVSKNAVTMPNREIAIAQNASALSFGKATSRAPICDGNKYVAKPACGAVVNTMKT